MPTLSAQDHAMHCPRLAISWTRCPGSSGARTATAAATRRYSPLLAVTRRYSPLLAVTRRYSPLLVPGPFCDLCAQRNKRSRPGHLPGHLPAQDPDLGPLLY